MAFVRIFTWAAASLGIVLALTFAHAWMMRPAVVPDDVDAIRMVAVASSEPHRIPEFRLENTGSRPALVASDDSYQGVMFRLDIFDPDGTQVPLPRGGCAILIDGPPMLTTLKPGQRSERLERGHPLRRWLSERPVRPGRYRFVATYRYTPFDARWQGLPVLSRWSEVECEKDARNIRRTRAFTRTMDFEIDLP